jgi:hypothetical protein
VLLLRVYLSTYLIECICRRFFSRTPRIYRGLIISKLLSTKEFFITDLKSGELYFLKTTLECEIFDFSTFTFLRSLIMARHDIRT